MVEVHNLKFTKMVAFLFLLLVISLPSVARAAAPLPVNVAVEGVPLIMDVPPVIVEDRTLVGVRFVGEAVGGTVEWDQELRQATVTRGADTIILTIGQKIAIVNGQPVTMEVPAQLVNDRTMVPIRFIAEALGFTVEWEEATRTANIWRRPTAITGLAYESETGKSRIRLALSEPPISVKPLSRGSTVTLDLYPAVIALDQTDRLVYDSLMRAYHLRADGRTVQLEVGLWNSPSFRHRLSDDGRELILEFDHTVTGVRIGQDGRIPQVTIAATGSLNYIVTELQNPARLVLDLPEAPLDPAVPGSVTGNQPYLTGVRTGPREEGGSRVVIDLEESLPYEIISGPLGIQVQFVPRLQSVRTEELVGKTRLTLATNLPVDAKVTLQADQKRLLVELPQAVNALPESLVRMANGAVDTVSVAPGPIRNTTLITISLPYYLGHTVISKNGDTNIVIDLVSSSVYGKRIWIDAGHGKIPGGKDDPGTIGKTHNTFEKRVNLEVALELQKRLEALGATVFMTRTGDEGVDFTDRPDLVNAVTPGIDIFISIHHNAATSPTTRGTETYYWTTNPKSKRLAEQVHAGVVKSLGFPDRRVRTESFYVIKEVQAPAILVELGYLSNADEEWAIAEPGLAQRTYPANAANGLVNGILDYFWQEIRSQWSN